MIIYSCNDDVSKTIISNKPLITYYKINGDIHIYHSKFEIFTDTLNFYNDSGYEFCIDRKFNKARENFLIALDIIPNNVLILNNLGNLEREVKNFNESINYYQKSLIESKGEYFIAGINLGKTLSIIGEDIRSEDTLKRIIDNTKIDFFKGLAYFELEENHLRYGNISKGKKALSESKLILKNFNGFKKDLKGITKRYADYYK